MLFIPAECPLNLELWDEDRGPFAPIETITKRDFKNKKKKKQKQSQWSATKYLPYIFAD